MPNKAKGNNPICPKCGKPTRANGLSLQGQQRYRCPPCKYYYTDTRIKEKPKCIECGDQIYKRELCKRCYFNLLSEIKKLDYICD